MTRKIFVETSLRYKGFPSILYAGPACGQDENGFDCSGFIVFLLRKMHFPLQKNIRHCSEFFDQFGVTVHRQYAGAGDLVFFSRNGNWPTHIGILISASEYIHAPGVRDSAICVCKLEHSEIKKVATGGASLYHSNPIGFKRLALPNGRYQKLLE